MYVTKGGGGVKRDFEKKNNIGNRIVQFQTIFGYANSKKWDVISF